MKNINKILFAVAILGMTFLGVMNATAQTGDLPIDAEPGKCYAKCLIPDEYETVTEEILVKEGSSRLEVIAAQYETLTEEIMVKEGYTVLEIVPPTYTTVTEEILAKEASSRLEYVPPVYETLTEELLISPSTTKWVRGKADPNCVSQNPDDCMVWCLTEIPAQYRTVTKQVLQAAASTVEVAIPAEYKTVTKTVVQTPASTIEQSVPAEYRTVSKQVLSSPAATSEIAIPAEYKTISSRKMVSAGGFSDYREVLCEANLTTSTVIAIQRALRDKGFDPGPIDNVLGSQTKTAVIEFQKANDLPVGTNGNNIPMATLKALGIY